MNASVPSAKRTVVSPVIALIEDRNRQPVADADEVGHVDQGIDGGDVTLFGESAEQGFDGTAVLSGFHSEATEDTAPGGQGGNVGQRGLSDCFEHGPLLLLIEVHKLGR